MKNKLSLILCGLVCTALCTVTSLAANRVSNIDIDVALQPDGSAHVTQTWYADTDEGTEFYLARNDSGYLTYTDFSVSDQHGPYTLVDNWDIEATIVEKSNRCGILETDDGVELCWGISQYGENTYTVEYVVHDLVNRYSDADGFNHRFIDDMDFFPTNVTLTIRNQNGTALTDTICDIWAFGFDGQIVFENGVIRAWSDSPLESGHHMTIMVGMAPGVVTPARSVADSFETVKERAFENSDYDDGEGGFLETIITLVVSLFIFSSVVLSIVGSFLNKKRLKKRYKKANYFHDSPNEGNLNVSHKLGVMGRVCKEDTLLGAYLLRLISSGCLEPTAESIDAKAVDLQLVKTPDHSDPFEDILYTVLEAAAGPDGVLQNKELENYCRANPTPLVRFMDSCQSNANTVLSEKGAFANPLDRDSFSSLSEAGLQQLDEVFGFQKYLLDFSLIHERGVKETVIWQDCMVYAYLLGIADKVAPQLRKLYPHAIPQMQDYDRYIRYTSSYNSILYRSYARERKAKQKARSSGSGGHSSFGGGGGFSGGGRGGSR